MRASERERAIARIRLDKYLSFSFSFPFPFPFLSFLFFSSSQGVFAGFMLLSLVGSLCFVPAFSLESFVPAQAPMVLTAIMVACNTSPAVFLALSKLKELTSLSLRALLLGYGVLSAVTGAVCGATFLSLSELNYLRNQQNKVVNKHFDF